MAENNGTLNLTVIYSDGERWHLSRPLPVLPPGVAWHKGLNLAGLELDVTVNKVFVDILSSTTTVYLEDECFSDSSESASEERWNKAGWELGQDEPLER